MKTKIRNIKTCKGWCWQEKKAMRIIREHFKGKRRTTCIAIYQSLTELASNNGSDVLNAFNAQVAEFSGKSISTVKNYARDLIELGLLRKRLRKKGKKNLANEWGLLATSVNNNYPTSEKNGYLISGKNKSLRMKENLVEDNNKTSRDSLKNGTINKEQAMAASEGYKKFRATANSLRKKF